jgi:hypothetical protein
MEFVRKQQYKESEVVLKSTTIRKFHLCKQVFGFGFGQIKTKDYKSCKEILLTIPSDYENYDQVQV